MGTARPLDWRARPRSRQAPDQEHEGVRPEERWQVQRQDDRMSPVEVVPESHLLAVVVDDMDAHQRAVIGIAVVWG